MHDTTAVAAPQQQRNADYIRNPNYAELHRHYPSTDYLRRRARRHIPHFAFEYSDGGSGKDDAGIRRNWAALDAVELVPALWRHAVAAAVRRRTVRPPLFRADRRGADGRAVDHLARRRSASCSRRPTCRAFLTRSAPPAAPRSRRSPQVAPDVFWFQLYRLARNDHAIGLDLVRRAEAAGCRTLVLTLDVPVRTTRPREVATGIAGAFNLDLRILMQIARAPGWAMALRKNGIPRFANLRSYVGDNASLNEVIAFARRECAAPLPGTKCGSTATAGKGR